MRCQPRIVDLREFSRARDHRDHGRIDVTGATDTRLEQASTDSIDTVYFFAEQVADHVEIVDRLVEEEPPPMS